MAKDNSKKKSKKKYSTMTMIGIAVLLSGLVVVAYHATIALKAEEEKK
jgi:flagellar basal body-associated protein FliL